MERTAVEWLANEFYEKLEVKGDGALFNDLVNQAKEMEKQQQGYTEEQLFKIINDFCFDWNYNYKGELSQKQYLIEWFEKFKNK